MDTGMNHGSELPKIVDKSQAEIDEIIAVIEDSSLSASVKAFAISCIRTAVWLPKALLEQKIRLSNLRKLIFGRGKGGGKRRKKNRSDAPEADAANDPVPENPPEDCKQDEDTPATSAIEGRTGHGRLPHTAYTDATEHTLTIAGYSAGDLCPEGCGGKLYPLQPGILVRVRGQNFAAVHKYHIQKLRCGTCSHLVQADIPSEIGTEKYDAAFKSILVLQKYYVAVPFHRQAYFQLQLDMPLPVSTQWNLVEDVGSVAIPVFSAMERKAANGNIMHNDDTHTKITSLIHMNRTNPGGERTGTFTTGILSRSDDHDIALFYNGTKHAGENLEKLLRLRDPKREPVIQMCDALSRNIPGALKTILCNCLSHGLRKFDELREFYPDQCLHIIGQIAQVYRHDDEAADMGKEERLVLHQTRSKPVMDDLHQYITEQMASKKIEPNESLGRAMRYMLKHWPELTQFLRVAGAPLDNNILERALKIPIRGRRTWLFYKTPYGAMIGGVMTSVIHTCVLAGVNPLRYLTVLQEHKDHVIKEPGRWLPWNYQDNLSSPQSDAA